MDDIDSQYERNELIVKLALDRPLAHEVLFEHRHRDESPEYHREVIRFLHSDDRGNVVMIFREGAKSTLAEEDIVIDACLKDFHNCVIVGASLARATERLAAVKREFENNEKVRELFGDLVGHPWQETKIVLATGVCIQAIGRDQAVRGTKHGDWRPDRILVDDVEDRESVQTSEGRRKTMLWFLAELLPAGDVNARVRVLATPLDRESVPQRLIDEARWPALVVPIEHKGAAGERVASWPARFPLPEIDRMMENYRRLGMMHVWAAERMCQAVSEADRVFTHLPLVPRARTWEATYAMIDPARTVRNTSASTGIAVWSWVGPKLVVWRAKAGIWLPDRIIDEIFDIDEEFGPVWIGFEEDGLNEWGLQPIRQEQLKRGRVVPLRAMKAPRGKIDFVKGLQPYAAAGEIECAEPCPDLDTQLQNFPSGRIDVPNALAYALLMRPGQAVYDNWSRDHIAEGLEPMRGLPLWLALHATNALTAGVLFQIVGRQTLILADFAAEGDAGEAVPLIAREAAMLAPEATVVCGPGHWERYTNVGLVQAVKALPRTVARGVEPQKGREVLRRELDRQARQMPAVRIASTARRVLNGFAGGYARMMRNGVLQPEPEQGLYRVLMEALESGVGMAALAEEIDAGRDAAYATTQDGRRYLRYGQPERTGGRRFAS